MEQTTTNIPDNSTERLIRINRFKLIADIILIVVILLIGWYMFNNIEAFKALSGDVCRLCEQKTGGTCQRFGMSFHLT